MAEAHVNSEICKKIHERVDERLRHHERWLGEHEKKIDNLERSDAINVTEIKNLCKSIDSQSKKLSSLTKAIWGLVSGIFMLLLGFVIWYIQQRG